MVEARAACPATASTSLAGSSMAATRSRAPFATYRLLGQHLGCRTQKGSPPNSHWRAGGWTETALPRRSAHRLSDRGHIRLGRHGWRSRVSGNEIHVSFGVGRVDFLSCCDALLIG